jgi:hypothetical protein
MCSREDDLSMIDSRMYAKTTDQGTAASETALCDKHYTWQNRETLEDAADADITGPWVDATGNDALECQLHEDD